MGLFRTLITSIFVSLLWPCITLSQTIEFPVAHPIAVPTKLPVGDFNPDFLLQLVQSNFQLISSTFNDPANGFNIITDPQQRIEFLQSITSSLSDITGSLSTIVQQFGINVDNNLGTIIQTINNEVNGLYESIALRASEYILPLNTSIFEVNTDFVIHRLGENIINQVLDPTQNFIIQIPIILQQLNHSLYDLSLQINTADSYIVTDALATYNILLLKLSDLQNSVIATSIDIISKINTDVCSFVSNCDLYCGIWDKNLQIWVKYPSKIVDMHQVSCTLPINSNSLVYATVSTSEFLPIGVFNRESDSSDTLSTSFIVFISITVFVFVLTLAYGVKKYYQRNKYGTINNPENITNYQSV